MFLKTSGYYSAIKSILGFKNTTVIIQANKEVNKMEPDLWNGELDLYANDDFNFGYELLIEGNDLMGHILRKYVGEKPDYFKKFSFPTEGR